MQVIARLLSLLFAAVALILPAVAQNDLPAEVRRSEAAVELANDESRHIVDARLHPYSAVGKFKGTMTCTAAVVLHPRIIITAAHCITERDGATKRSNLSFRLGYQAGTDLGRFEAKVWAVGSKQSFKPQSAQDAAQDWAILVLDRAPDGVRPFLLSHHSFETWKSFDRKILMPSYSNDIGAAEVLSVDPVCSVRDLVWNVFVHDCKASLGSSGAPLLIRDQLRDPVRYAVIGVHTGSMFASDEDGHVAEFIGNRAIGSWMFNEALQALSRRLNGDANHDVPSAAD